MSSNVSLGASKEAIQEEEEKLNCVLPNELKEILLLSNGLELPSGWYLFPVFDHGNPRKTCNSIHYENTKGRWSFMEEDLLSIAHNGTGNQLVLKVEEGRALSCIYVWNHETRKVKPWKSDFFQILEIAKKRVSRIQKQVCKRQCRKA